MDLIGIVGQRIVRYNWGAQKFRKTKAEAGIEAHDLFWKGRNPASPHSSPPHPTPLRPSLAAPVNAMASPFYVITFPASFMVLPIIGTALGLVAAPSHGQVALGIKQMALAPMGHWGKRASLFAQNATWPLPGADAMHG